uniref:Cytochrome c oxidase subunit 8A, mitochondrial n=1 Tax=Anolis carolinensis TaxID=28377 RepID=A0A803TXN1_ANOCA
MLSLSLTGYLLHLHTVFSSELKATFNFHKPNGIDQCEQVIALSVMFAAFLIPSGWVLSHLEDYKNHSRE